MCVCIYKCICNFHSKTNISDYIYKYDYYINIIIIIDNLKNPK